MVAAVATPTTPPLPVDSTSSQAAGSVSAVAAAAAAAAAVESVPPSQGPRLRARWAHAKVSGNNASPEVSVWLLFVKVKKKAPELLP